MHTDRKQGIVCVMHVTVQQQFSFRVWETICAKAKANLICLNTNGLLTSWSSTNLDVKMCVFLKNNKLANCT